MAKKEVAQTDTTPIKLEPAQSKLLRDTTRYLCINAMRRNPALTEIVGEVPFTRKPLTDGAIRAARDVVQTTLCGETLWPGAQTSVTSEFVRDTPEANAGKVKFRIAPKAPADA